MRKRRRQNEEPVEKRAKTRLIITVSAAVLIVCVFAVATAKIVHIYSEELPSIDQLYDIEPSLITYIYAKDGSVIQTYFNERRVLIPFKDIPEHVINALLAAEDAKFYNHWGISSYDVMRAIYKNVTEGFGSQGASTISQQLARMLFLNRKVSLMRKFKEALTAIKIERTYSKNEIIEMYLNQYYFGRGAYGIAAAAHAFFSKSVGELEVNDCAILIGVLKAPNTNSPFKNPDKCRRARDRVLYSYYRCG
ncbi:MAG: transglycosylase domain-containing protein, partial [candidate division Zixibacteria bacterium]|nr:transglycosylase domain-containing protein [candidate division Zixibacteria bacterium]